MKQNGLYPFLGCCVIAIAILISGFAIAYSLPETTRVPSSLSVQTQNTVREFGDYLSLFEAAVYLRVTEEEISALAAAGELDSAMIQIGENYVISKQALQAWFDGKLGK